VEGPTANGLDRDRHHKHGRMAINDMHRKTVDHLVSIGPLVVDTTDEDPSMTTGHRRLLLQEIGAQIGAMAQMRDMATSPHHLARVAILCQMYPVTVRMAVIDGEHLYLAMYTFRPTTKVAHDDHGNLMNDSDMVLAILVTQEKGLPMIDRIGTELTVTENEPIGSVILVTLVAKEEMVEPDQGVRNGGTGIVITGTTTFIGGVSAHRGINGIVFEVKWYALESNLSNWAYMGDEGHVI
jgi:hypothetical protein